METEVSWPKWQAQQIEVYVYLAHAFYAIAFLGKITQANGTYFIQPPQEGGVFAVSPDSAICQLKTDPVTTVGLVHVATGARLFVSETKVEPVDLFARFPLPNTIQ